MKIRHLPIRHKIIFSGVSILCAAVIIIGVFFWYSFSSALKKNAYESLNSSIVKAEESLLANFDLVENTLFSFFNIGPIRDWKGNILELNPEIPSFYSSFSTIRNEASYTLMFNRAWTSKLIHSSYVAVDDSLVSLHSPRSIIKDDAANFQRVYDITRETLNHTTYVPPLSSQNFAYIVKEFYNVNQSRKLTFISSIDPHNFAKALYQLPEDITASLMDENGVIYFSNNDSLIGTTTTFELERLKPTQNILGGYETTQEQSRQLLVLRKLPGSNFSIIVSAPVSIFSRQVAQSVMGYLIITVIILAVFIFLSVTFSSAFTRFFIDITENLNKIRQKNYETTMPAYTERDLNSISSAFNSMTSEIKRLINTVYREKLLLKEADIKLLQSQMNPHFLINTLTTVSSLALLHGDEQIYKMVDALSEILDASLYNYTGNNTFIPIAKEIEYVNCYLYLQHIRFQEKLEYNIHVADDALLGLYIPRLSVEPLVENAVVHGLGDNIGRGIVNISIYREGDAVAITITDNGKGFDVEKTLSNDQHASAKGHNISIKNVNRRLKLMFGEGYGIHFESEPGIRTTAYLRFPVLEQPNLNEE